ncbi:MerR family transcriptional regulator [Lactobacillus selangorensis]|uniref:MerR family transcriptional regulator n=1 Tax=Lactobacillus selangorensis TaxID=81857 RepID=A0A0R2FQQ9_9LACO|nr:MerR family transcriptional regulator [Lactobacillus selangorensis]KRN28693.1 MerR family transcriptional regulator [Lactobacillus selangorensis]KRN32896.1 MerR family transcriptional regulator [Lactobacillus selangorensis]
MNIKKVSETLGLSIDTIRYYERVGVIPPVKRDKNGYRDYQTEDLNWLYLAKSLKRAGLSVDEMIEFERLSKSADHPGEAQKKLLQKSLNSLEQRIQTLEHTKKILQYKIAHFDTHIGRYETNEAHEKLWEKHFSNEE